MRIGFARVYDHMIQALEWKHVMCDRFRAWKHFLKVPTEASSNKVYEINPALTERLMIVIGR